MIRVVSALRVLPEQLLHEADSMRSNCGSNDFPTFRGVVHLAYYATYHYLSRKLGMSTVGDSGVKHRQLARLISNEKSSDPRIEAGKINFSNLMTLRFRSDYDLEAVIDQDDADDALDWAHNIIEA